MSKSRSGAPRRVAAGLLAGSLAVLGLAFAPPAGATADATVDRAAGATRYGTAAAVSTEAYADGSDCVLIATGEGFADALAASGLAGADDCPILLVTQNTIPEETSAAIDDLGASSATIVGGTAAVSQDVEDALSSELGLTVDRVAGQTRYDTAGEVADAIGGDGSTVLIASGEVAPDALSLGPIAANLGAPILLVTTDGLPSATENHLGDATEVIIAGGTARISDDNQTAIEDASNDADGAERLAGVNRQETSVEVANYEVDTLGWGPTTALLAAPSAPNDDFSPDALVAGPLGGLREAPVLIVTDADTLGPAGDFLDDHSDTITEVFLIGGTAVLSDEIFTAAETAAQNTSNDEATGDVSLTDAPELVSVDLVNLTSTGGSVGIGQLLLRYNFDETVLATPILQAGFKIYDAYGEYVGSTSAQRNSSDDAAVDVVFDVGATGGGTNAFALGEGTVLTVVSGAVQDADGKVNPEGDVAGSIGHSFAAGTTRNPDLTAVQATSGNSTQTSYDFSFDSAVAAATAANFQIVDSDGTMRPGTGATLVADANGANTIVRVTFAAPASTTTTAVRGNALNGAVTASTTLKNPTQSADISNGGQSDSPDLVSVTLDDVNDRVTYTFDETVDTPVLLRAGFHVFYRTENTGANSAASNVATDVSSADNRSVVAQFTQGAINEFVAGAYVDAGAVDRNGGTVKNNQVDEVGIASSYAGGDYLGPELVSAVASSATNVFGTETGRKVTFTWDDTVTLNNAAGFFVTDSDGNRTNLTGCVLGSGTGTAPTSSTTVTCTFTGTSGTVFTEIGDSELATTLYDVVRSTTIRTTQSGTQNNFLKNHEERAAAPGPARDQAA